MKRSILFVTIFFLLSGIALAAFPDFISPRNFTFASNSSDSYGLKNASFICIGTFCIDAWSDVNSSSGGIGTVQSTTAAITVQNGTVTNLTLNLPFLNNTHTLSCSNITGSSSNLCTLTDTDTDTNNYTVACSVYGTTSKTVSCSRNGGANFSFSFTDVDTDTSYAISNLDGFINVTNSTGVINFNLSKIASSSITGLLSSTDWSTFNNKAGTGTATCSGSNSTHVNVTMNVTTSTSGVTSQCVAVLYAETGTGSGSGNVTSSGNGTARYLAKFTNSTNIDNSSIFVGANGYIGIGTTNPGQVFHAVNTVSSQIGLKLTSNTSTAFQISHFDTTGSAGVGRTDLDTIPIGNNQSQTLWNRNINTTGLVYMRWLVGDGTTTANHQLGGNTDSYFCANNSECGFGDTTPLYLLTVGSGDLFGVNGSGHVLLADGSLGSPIIQWQSDPDTGIYRNGSNSITLVVGGAGRVKINATGLFENDNQTLTTASTFGGDVSGTNTSLQLGTGVVGDTELASSGVTAGVYGNSSHVSVITVNADGRITSATNTSIAPHVNNLYGWVNTLCPANTKVIGFNNTNESSGGLFTVYCGAENVSGEGSAGLPAFWTDADSLSYQKINRSQINLDNDGSCASGNVLEINSTGGLTCATDDTGAGSGSGNVTSSANGTANYVPYWTNASNLATSAVRANTTNVGIGSEFQGTVDLSIYRNTASAVLLELGRTSAGDKIQFLACGGSPAICLVNARTTNSFGVASSTGSHLTTGDVQFYEDGFFLKNVNVSGNLNGSAIYELGSRVLTTASTFGGDVTGNNGSLQIAADAVGTNEIATDGVGSAEIAAGAVTNSEIASAAVNATQLLTANASADGLVLKANSTGGLVWSSDLQGSGSGGGNASSFGSSGYVPYFFNASLLNNSAMYFEPNSSSFGLGTTDPNSTLHVVGIGNFTSELHSTTLNTGQGNNELYAMDQNVLTTSSPTFNDPVVDTITGNQYTFQLTNGSTAKFTEETQFSFYSQDDQVGLQYANGSHAVTSAFVIYGSGDDVMDTWIFDGKLGFGGATTTGPSDWLYKSATNILRTNSSFYVEDNLTVTQNLNVTGYFNLSTNVTVGDSSWLGTVRGGTWNGAAITDNYISSASAWNAKANNFSVQCSSASDRMYNVTLNSSGAYAVCGSDVGGSGSGGNVTSSANGTAGYGARWTNSTDIATGMLRDSGAAVSIGDVAPQGGVLLSLFNNTASAVLLEMGRTTAGDKIQFVAPSGSPAIGKFQARTTDGLGIVTSVGSGYTTGDIRAYQSAFVDKNLTVTGNVSASVFKGTIDCSNITGGGDSDFCNDATGSAGSSNASINGSFTQYGVSFVQNASLLGTNSNVTITQDAGNLSVSSSICLNGNCKSEWPIFFFGFNGTSASQSNSLNSTSVGGWTNLSNLTLYLPAGFHNIECYIAESAAAATTGVQFIFNVTNTTARNHLLEYYTSTTAQALAQATSVAMTVGATASSGTTISPARYYGHYVVDVGAVFWVQFATEINGSAVTVNRGSYCRSFEATA